MQREGGRVPALIDGRYRVEALLGQGGMGTVHRAHDESTGRALALKRLTAKAARDERHALMFHREFDTLARLAHPNIVRVFDFGWSDDVPYYTMELLEGGLGDVEPPLPVDQVCTWMRDIASALALIHSRNLIHRDVTARNVAVTERGAKLIDFGALATPGLAGEILGTAPYMAPETLAGQPLDHRIDLYALGALAYWLLSGRHAFAARKPGELEQLWKKPPRSLRRHGVQWPLEELVMQLLSLQPLARPRSAAEVARRLEVIAELAPKSADAVVAGYLSSAPLVERDSTLSLMRGRIDDLVAGHGHAVVIEGIGGIGRTRLLNDLAIEGQLAGAAIVHVDCAKVTDGAWGVLRAIATQLAARDRSGCMAAAGDEALARVLPRLAGTGAPIADEKKLRGLGLENEQARGHAAATRWICQVVSARPYLILLDNCERIDDLSASVLSSLLHARAGLLVMAVCTEAELSARSTPLFAQAARVCLSALSRSAVSQLVVALFAQADHAEWLANVIYERVGGVPRDIMAVAEHLVAEGTITMAHGAWRIPEALDVTDLPADFRQASARVVARLGSDARGLAELMAVHGRDVPVLMLRELCGGDEVFAALDELIRHGIAIGNGRHYRVRHTAVREALLAALDPEQTTATHRRIGEWLDARAKSPSDTATSGMHLLHGGHLRRGAERLARAGERLFEAASFREAQRVLGPAIEVLEQQRDDLPRLLELRFKLLRADALTGEDAGCTDETIARLRHHGAIDVAERLGPLLGKRLAFYFAMLFATVRWLLSFGKRPRPSRCVWMYVVSIVYASAAASVALHVERMRELMAMLSPLAFSYRSPMYGAYELVRAGYLNSQGDFEEMTRVARERLPLAQSQRRLAPTEKKMAEAVWRFMLALCGMSYNDPDVLVQADALDALDLPLWRLSATMLRATWHRHRGEEGLARRQRAKAQTQLVELGGHARLEAFEPVQQVIAALLTRDLPSLRNASERLERFVDLGMGYQGWLYLARGVLTRELGDLDGSERLLARADEHGLPVVRPMVRVAQADLELARGRHREAQLHAQAAIDMIGSRDMAFSNMRARAQRSLALALMGLGDREGAAKLVAQLASRAKELDHPALRAMACGVAARLAQLEGDADAAQAQLDELELLAARCESTAMAAEAHRLRDLLALRPADDSLQGGDDSFSERDTDIVVDAVTELRPGAPPGDQLRAALLRVSDREHRQSVVLDVVLTVTGSARGHLFAVDRDFVQHVAPRDVAVPSHAVFVLAQRAAVEEVAPRDGEASTVVLANGDRRIAVAVLTAARRPLPDNVAGVLAHALDPPAERVQGQLGSQPPPSHARVS